MRSTVIILVVLLVAFSLKGQDNSISDKDTHFPACLSVSISKESLHENTVSLFALSFNPLGLLQFGPSFSTELKLKENLVLNTRLRFPALGELSYVIQAREDGLNEFSGLAYGGGLIRLTGKKRNKPYMGIIFQYQSTRSLYAENENREWSRSDKAMILLFNGGYRFRFAKGYFINTGILFGAARDNFDWEYTDPSYGTHDSRSRNGTIFAPFGMLELTVGIGFKPSVRKIFKSDK